MGKRFWSLVLSAALIAGVFTALPAQAQTEPGATGGVIPAAPNIVDDASDANAGALPVTFTGADVLAGWFTHDATNVYVHIQTTTDVRAEATTFQTTVGPAAGLDCVQLRMVTAGEANDSFSAINVSGDCGDVPTTQYGPLLEEVGPEDTGILTGTFPRDGLEVLAEGALLAEPDIVVGMYGHGNPVAGGSRIGAIDDTAVGTDYSVKDDEVEEPKKKKKAKKPAGAKNKKSKKSKKPKKPKAPQEPAAPAACPAFVPGEQGAEAETTVITDAATEEAPVTAEYTAEMGGPSSPLVAVFDFRSFLYHNIQVDSVNPDAGLYVKIEFTDGHDYDLGLFHPDGTEAASSGESQPEPGLGGGSPDGAWEGGSNYEFLKGIRTSDCAGYTARIAGYLTTGGPVTVSMWLGDVAGDPAAPGGGETAMDMFLEALGL